MQSIQKGTLYIGVKQVIFLFTGYAIHIGLGRYLGPELYGIYAITIVLLTTTVNNFFISGMPQATSKFISEDVSRTDAVKRTAFEIQFSISFLAFLVYFFFATFIASLLNDPKLVTYIRLSSIMIIPFAMLAVISDGYFNGLRKYSKQSISWAVSYISKPILIFGLVFAGFSVFGAVLGFALAPVIGLIVALYFAGLPKRVKPFSRKKILLFAFPVTLQVVLTQYITNIDLLVLKALVEVPEEIGYYSAASMISKVPVSLLAALNMAIFPAISATTYQNDTIRTKTYVSESLRYLIMLIVPASIMISLTSGELVSLLYSSTYILAGEPLKILILGVFFFGLFAYFLNIIIAAGKPKISMILSAIILFIAFMLNLSLIPMLGMIGAALATTLSCLIGAAISALYTYRLFHTLTYKLTILRVLIASAAVIPLFLIKVSGILLLGQYLIAFLLYLAVLKIIGELRKDDLRNVMFVFK